MKGNIRNYALGVIGAMLAWQEAQAGLVVGFMADKNGQGVQEAVFYATPLDASAPGAAPTELVVLNQENYQFTPYVAVLRKGTSVKFANRDTRDHHIKSFALTKAFEMRVPGKSDAAQTVLFDKVGDVPMVCHFHDTMRGFIYVIDTPYFSKTDKGGNAILNNLPPGKYQIQAWVPTMVTPPYTQNVTVSENGSVAVRFQLDFVPKPPPAGRAPAKPAASTAYTSAPGA
jgi:plastocyanin